LLVHGLALLDELDNHPRKVLDIAAGHGLYGIAVAKVAPNAEIVAVDWRAVLAIALRNAEKAGVGDRYRTIPGSAFDVDWGNAYDLVLLPGFLHHFDHQTCVALLAKIRAGLSSLGQTWAVELVPNEDRVSPVPMPATFAYTMLATTPKGDAHTPYQIEAAGAVTLRRLIASAKITVSNIERFWANSPLLRCVK
jgi:O-methyltransferase domain